MRLYTRGGDQGETGLIGGTRVPKDHPRVVACGEIDELNAAIGSAAAACDDDELLERLHQVQERLLTLGAELANPGADKPGPTITDADAAMLEGWIDSAGEAVTPLSQFVLPGGSELAARFHLARAVGRRAERSVVRLSREVKIASGTIVYLNRLSDLLFAWARLANARANVADITWKGRDPTRPG